MTAEKLDFKATIMRGLGNLIRPVYTNGQVNFIFHIYKIKTVVGENTYGKINVYSYQKKGEVAIGRYTSISEISLILGGDHHRGITVYPFKSKFLKLDTSLDNQSAQNIIIGNDCWIGHNVTIMEGVTIASGSIIGANSLVTRSTNAYSINVGSPSKEISKRFSEEEIAKLLESKWWELPKNVLLKYLDLLYGNDIDEFLIKIKK